MFAPLLMTLFMTPALARTAYVGVALVGHGRGVLGHVFLTFAREPDAFLDARFYQFAIEVPADFHFDAGRLDQLARFPFRVETGEAWPLIRAYVADDRAVMLHRLDLSDAAVRRLEALAEAERRARVDRPRRDFSLQTNCATRAFDLVNAVAGARPIRYLRPNRLLNPLELWRADRVALAIPILAAPRLARHPLVRESVTFRPGNVVEIERALVATTEVERLYRACGVSDGAREIMTRVYGAPDLRRSTKYVAAFAALFARCDLSPALKELYNGHLDFVRFDAGDPALNARVEAAYRR